MMNVQVANTLAQVDPAAWDALVGDDNPFVEHGFLSALEASGCVGTPHTGWVPRHVLLLDEGRLIAAMPLYEKYDSYGEYIFDWAWAQGAERAGLAYYPKLVSAVPFTPATGCRLLCHPQDRERVAPIILHAVRELADALQASSIHVLFCAEAEQAIFSQHGLMSRQSYQFHWHRQPDWHTFADYLGALRAPSRKQVRRERQQALSHGLQIRCCSGTALQDHDWQALYRFYLSTIADKHALAYLTPAFFAHVRQCIPERVLAILAYDRDEPVAGALYFHKGKHLYGRYWGTVREGLDALHFELCYYQPIEWALQHGIERFEAGAQGEHKLKRGLLPALCHSAHWLRHPALAAAVQQYIAAEATGVVADMTALAGHTPFRRGDGC